MGNNPKIVDFENVNGVNLTLQMHSRIDSPNSQRFTISYTNKKKKSKWPLKTLILAIIFNIIALYFVRISLLVFVIISLVLSFLIFFWVTHSVQSESVVVIPTVGVQSTVKYVFGREDCFVPWTCIDDVIINEVIKLNRVLYFLTLIVKTGQDMDQIKLVPLFKYTKPRLVMLESIYSELQDLLDETSRQYR